MNRYPRQESGFTLIEIAIVLLIVAILLGYTVALFPVQQELKKYRQADKEMTEIIDSLIGFAQINGRLPCPDSPNASGAVNGIEDVAAGGCVSFFSYLPAGTLGIVGDYDNSGSLLDPWKQPYRYAVSESDFDGGGDSDFVVANQIRSVGMASAIPDISICSDSAALGIDLNCAEADSTPVAASVAAVIISTGKDLGRVASNIQTENLDDFNNGTNDKVYVSSTRSDVVDAEYDDVVKWISTNQLFTKMIEADQLP